MILSLCLASSQAALLVLTPILAALAADLGVSTAAAGQLRTISGLCAGTTALLTGLAASRVGLRELLLAGIGVLALGSAISAATPSFEILAVAQLLIGIGVGITYSVAVAAAAEWSRPDERSRVLALALLGPPLAWVVGMPIAGVVGDLSWRLAWVAVPFGSALVALFAVFRRPSTQPTSVRASLRVVLAAPGAIRWSCGELLAYSGWAGCLVFVGALFVESYGLSLAATGLVLGAGALAYIPGNLLARRWVDRHSRALLIGLALALATTVALLGAVRYDVWSSLAIFSALSFLAGGRTLVGSASGLHLAPHLRLGITGVRTAALQFGYFIGAALGGLALGAGGYKLLGLAFSALFVGAALPHIWPRSRASEAEAYESLKAPERAT